MNPKLSIIIPTYKRPATLAECLHHLESQTIADDVEVIIISDGHDEETVSLFAKRNWRVPTQFFAIEKKHQGAARNRGVQEAKAPYCLFIGDDIFLDAHACEEHVRTHEVVGRNAVLGHTTWNPRAGVTPIMEWLEKSGWQFAYPHIRQYAGTFLPKQTQHQYTYTSHISIPTSVAKKHLFREDVLLYGWEDVEWGLRLRDTGVGVYYQPRAKSLHHHAIQLKDSLKRMEILGESVVHMATLLPGFDRMPHGWKRFAYEVTALFPTIAGNHRKAFLRGIKQAQKQELRSPGSDL